MFARGVAHVFAEEAGKVEWVGKADGFGDLLNGAVGVRLKEGARLLESVIDLILFEAASGDFFEEARDGGLATAGHARGLFEREADFGVLADVFDDGRDEVVVFVLNEMAGDDQFEQLAQHGEEGFDFFFGKDDCFFKFLLDGIVAVLLFPLSGVGGAFGSGLASDLADHDEGDEFVVYKDGAAGFAHAGMAGVGDHFALLQRGAHHFYIEIAAEGIEAEFVAEQAAVSAIGPVGCVRVEECAIGTEERNTSSMKLGVEVKDFRDLLTKRMV